MYILYILRYIFYIYKDIYFIYIKIKNMIEKMLENYLIKWLYQNNASDYLRTDEYCKTLKKCELT